MPTSVQDLQSEILSTVRRSQETMLDVLKTLVDNVQSVAPKIPAVQIPLADKMPKPEDVVNGAYDLAERLLASQRRFAEEVLKATTPLLPGTSPKSPKTPETSQDAN
jgi:hypothetical protein